MKLSKNDLKKYHLFVGPMSKNVVDAAIELSKLGKFLGLIPSRRQIENTGGYVNNWTTEEFVNNFRRVEGWVEACEQPASTPAASKPNEPLSNGLQEPVQIADDDLPF